ncbi:hypothetical protein [Demequina aurantiaca]|uniref:hypothetical protein n=1 Tax=Demequina aurantiaca TaxID=676200 RepID=UPI003D34CE4A
MTRIAPTSNLKPLNGFFSAAITWALFAALIFGLVAGLILVPEGDSSSFAWGWFLGSFALSGLLFLPIVLGFEALRRVGYNQRILGAKLDAIHDQRGA